MLFVKYVFYLTKTFEYPLLFIMIACEEEMLDNQSGAVTALDSDGNPIPGVLDPNGTGVPLTGNESSLSLKFEEEQLVTNVKIKVSPNVEGAAIQYTDENGNVVSKKFNILPN